MLFASIRMAFRLHDARMRLERSLVERRRVERRRVELALEERRLEALVRDKETLMRELEPRVKNSMTLISSLFSLESARLPDDATKQVFEDAQDRVRTISSSYDLLSRSNDSESLDSAVQIQELLRLFSETWLGGGSDIVIESRVESTRIPIKEAAAIGLIINELLTNAVKYTWPARKPGPPSPRAPSPRPSSPREPSPRAPSPREPLAPRGKGGRIVLDLHRVEGSIPIAVTDNGVGLPPGYDLERSDRLGLKLIQTLASQCGGSLSLSRGRGLCAKVVIPVASPAPQ